MKKETFQRITLVGILFLFMGLATGQTLAQESLSPQDIQQNQEVEIIKIRDVGYEGALRIEPSQVTIPVGMVIVWVNMTRQAEPRIEFDEGMKCELSTEASGDFRLDERQCFITDYVQVGGSSSLKFIGPGVFNYRVVNKTGQKGKGAIIVK